MAKFGLAIQGGGCRGVYDVGVLDVLMENGLWADEVIGCSAGAIFGMDYVAQQKGRGDRVAFVLSKDKKYFCPRKILSKRKTMFDYDYLLNDLAVNKIPFDFETFRKNDIKFKMAVCSCLDGKDYYIEKNDPDFAKGLEASTALPLTASPVEIRGTPYLDGGVAVSVPFKRLIEDGYEKIVVIATRTKGYRKKELAKMKRFLVRRMYKKYPVAVEKYLNVHNVYNAEMDEMDRLNEEGRIFVIYPSAAPNVGTADKDTEKLKALIELGRKDAEACLPALLEYLSK